ncbi:MAG: hypothetical protein WBC33_01730, partial [Conexibacter sp.]
MEDSRHVDDGWLIICFMGPPATNRAELPRVACWSSTGPPERVSLSLGARQLLAALAVPPLRLGVH